MTAAVFHLGQRPAGDHVSLLAILRPFLLLGVLAFLAGFGGYLILGPPDVMGLSAGTPAAAPVASSATAASADSPGDGWNLPKQI